MGKRRNGLLVLAMIAALALVAAACGDDDGGGETGSTTGGASGATALSGTITISGSSTVQPITSLVAELFNEDVSSDVSITVDGPGTGDGFVLFCDGETDIQDASRTIEDEEKAACDKNGIEYVELAVAFVLGVAFGALILAGALPAMAWIKTVGLASLWGAAVLTLITGWDYLRVGLKHMD